ncbi:MAG: efflux transporter periplasmic adaptor subunit [Comamonas sp. SCN 67-35]|uniref:efflux RND transporter periplasmic adaptor subunit n=1 Tax=unclassified Comamonas TaxID=2638500 RepID=UPI00086EDACD|nr:MULTISPECIES: efflux RND transporter periplasmic adaptor subunit [unclassified Comamonas]MBN9329663.1 efflux RND transporter periplasmic adaptor subunit [Comamonas sp.]ODU36907.1 MAG: efflux transporter periplasmic adaptor subunit [Comamonas sp. SCN 67-35]
MNNSLKKSLAGLTLIAMGVAAGWGLAQWRASSTHAVDSAAPHAAAAAERKVLYWYDPMSPTQKFDKPGKSPFMDMDLVPKYADEDAQGSTGISISAQTVQALGLRTAVVVQRAIGSDVDVVGNVLLNDRDVSIVQVRSAGFVERVYARAPGDVIGAGAPLADLLLPEWVAAQREFLAVRALKDESLTTAARQRLLLLGMPQALVAQVERTGEPRGIYTVSAPQGGLVAELMVRQGMTVSAGASLARVNGLATVWIEAAVPEAQSGPLQLGQEAQVRLAAFPGEVLRARIVSILPQANSDTRTVRVRLELANPGQRLKAGMSGQITLQGREQPALLVPSEAIIRTGKRALAYVVDGPGKFHPVEVQLGAEIGDQLVVQGGLEAGQQVVASAQFLIDSEASLRGLLPAVPGAAQEHGAHGAAPAYTVRGVVEEVSTTEMTLAHDAIPALKWPAMTMGFKLADPRLAAGLAPQQAVRFTFSKQGEDYVITAIEGTKP